MKILTPKPLTEIRLVSVRTVDEDVRVVLEAKIRWWSLWRRTGASSALRKMAAALRVT